jgi:hypothetical protein
MSRIAAIICVVTAGLASEATAKLPTCRGAEAPYAALELTNNKLRACYKEPTACFALDLGAAGGPTWVPVAAPRPDSGPTRDAFVPGVTIGTTAKVCAVDGTDCHSFVTPRAPVEKYSGPQIFANADRSLFAATIDDRVWLFEASGALRVNITTWPHPGNVLWSVDGAAFYGELVYVTMSDGSNVEIRAFDVHSGATSTDLGALARAEPIELGGGEVAFAARFGSRVDVYDHAGKRVHSVLGFADQKAALTLFARSADGKTIVLGREYSEGMVEVVDTTAWTSSMIAPPPRCP